MRFFVLCLALAAVGNGLGLNRLLRDAQDACLQAEMDAYCTDVVHTEEGASACKGHNFARFDGHWRCRKRADGPVGQHCIDASGNMVKCASGGGGKCTRDAKLLAIKNNGCPTPQPRNMMEDLQDMAEKLVEDVEATVNEGIQMVKGKKFKFTRPSPNVLKNALSAKFKTKREEMGKVNTEMMQKFRELAKTKDLKYTQAALDKFTGVDFFNMIERGPDGERVMDDFSDKTFANTMAVRDAIVEVGFKEMNEAKLLFTKNDEISRKVVSAYDTSRIMFHDLCGGGVHAKYHPKWDGVESDLADKCSRAVLDLKGKVEGKIGEMKKQINEMRGWEAKWGDFDGIQPERFQMMKKMNDQIRAIEIDEALKEGTSKEMVEGLKGKIQNSIDINGNFEQWNKRYGGPFDPKDEMEEQIKAKQLGEKSLQMIQKFKKEYQDWGEGIWEHLGEHYELLLDEKIKEWYGGMDKAELAEAKETVKLLTKEAREAIKSIDWPKMKEHKMLFTLYDEVSPKILFTFDLARAMIKNRECDLAAEERTVECDEAITLYEDSKDGVNELNAEIDVLMDADLSEVAWDNEGDEDMTGEENELHAETLERLQIAARMADEILTIETIEAFESEEYLYEEEPEEECAECPDEDEDSSAKSLFTSALFALLASTVVM